MDVELYLRKGHAPSDEALTLLRDVQQTTAFELREIDIDSDPALAERFGSQVPVVALHGKVWFKGRVEREAFVGRLERDRAFALGTLDPQKTLWRAQPVGRSTKVGFAIAVVLAIGAVFGVKAYARLVLDDQHAIAGLEVQRQEREAPDFELQGPGGTVTNIAKYRGRLLLVNFWATWCAPCREEMPSMQALAKALADEKFTILAVDVQEDWPTIDRFFAAERPRFDLALDPSGKAAEAYEQKRALQFPETFVVTPEGRVVGKFEGPRDWSDPAALRYLRKLLPK